MRWPWRRPNDNEMDEEISTHIEMAASEYRRQGFSAEAAQRKALIDFGGIEQSKEAQREADRFSSLDALWQDTLSAYRALRRNWAFAVMCIAILALGIGANTAVFSVVHSVLLRPLAYAHASRLIVLEEIIPQFSHLAPYLPVNGRHFLDWKQNAKTLDDAALADTVETNMTGGGDPERLNGSRATPNIFRVLGTTAQLGRTFVDSDAREKVTVITAGLWQRRFGARTDIVGQAVALNGVPHKIIGVLPHDYRDPFGRAVELYTPWEVIGTEWGWAGDHNYPCIARLRPGATVPQAIAELNVLQASIAKRFEETGRLDLLIRVTPLRERLVGGSRLALLTLMGAVALVLLITCLNLGNLMLSRSLVRSREMAVRAALGASTRRILRGIALEGLLLSLAGAAGAVLLAVVMVQVFRTVVPASLPRADEISLDAAAVAFAFGLALLTSSLFALVPIWHTRNVDPQNALRAGGRSITGTHGHLRQILTVAEVTLSVALLVLSGLLVRSALRLGAVDRGFDASHVLTAEVTLPESQYRDTEARRRFYQALVDRLNQEPGVVAAGVILKLPLRGNAWTDVVIPEGDTRPIAEQPILAYRPTTGGYFRAMGIPMIAGRTMEDRDYPRLPAVISARVAERVWPGQNPLGKIFTRAASATAKFEVVGVVGDVRANGLDQEPDPIVYVPLWMRASTTVSVAIRTSGDPAQATVLLRRAVRSLDAGVPIANVLTMSSIEKDTLAYRSLLKNLVVFFAVSALCMAALGIYSVLAWTTGRRKGEIGIRMTLGANAASVRSMILRQGLRPVLIGLLAGLAVSFATGRALASLLFQVSARDPLTYAVVVAITLMAAWLACWIPAFRASRVSPTEALRYE